MIGNYFIKKIKVKILFEDEKFDNPNVWYKNYQGQVFEAISKTIDEDFGMQYVTKDGCNYRLIRAKDCTVLIK